LAKKIWLIIEKLIEKIKPCFSGWKWTRRPYYSHRNT